MAYVFNAKHIDTIMTALCMDSSEFCTAVGCSISALNRWKKGVSPGRHAHLKVVEELYIRAKQTPVQLPLPVPTQTPAVAAIQAIPMPTPALEGAVRLLASSSLTDEELGALIRKLI